MLRRVKIDDAPALAALHAACFSHGQWSAQQLAGSLTLNTVYGYAAEQDGALTGFVLCQQAGDQAEILTLCVNPAYRRGGLGRNLMTQAQIHAQENGAFQLWLEVGADNPVACHFYETYGFRQQGKRRSYYQRGNQQIDALLYALTIKDADLHSRA